MSTTPAITLQDAAARLGVTYETLRRKAFQKKIPAFKVGGSGQWRIFEEDLLDYVRGQYAHDERSPEPASLP